MPSPESGRTNRDRTRTETDGGLTKTHVLISGFTGWAASPECSPGAGFLALNRCGPPSRAPQQRKTKLSSVFWGEQRPAGIAFASIRRGRVSWFKAARKRNGIRGFGRGWSGGRRGWRGRARDAAGGSRAARQDAAPRGAGWASDEFGEAGPCGAGAPSAGSRISGRVSLGGPGWCPPLVSHNLLCKGAARRRGVARAGVPAAREKSALFRNPRPGGWESRPRRSQGRAAPGPWVGEGLGDATDSDRCGARWGKFKMGGRAGELGWAAWRTGGRAVSAAGSRRGHPCLAGWRLRRRRGGAERGWEQFGEQLARSRSAGGRRGEPTVALTPVESPVGGAGGRAVGRAGSCTGGARGLKERAGSSLRKRQRAICGGKLAGRAVYAPVAPARRSGREGGEPEPELLPAGHDGSQMSRRRGDHGGWAAVELAGGRAGWRVSPAGHDGSAGGGCRSAQRSGAELRGEGAEGADGLGRQSRSGRRSGRAGRWAEPSFTGGARGSKAM